MINIYRVYKVIQGDSFQDIANKFNISLDDLLRLNGLNNDSQISAGMFIVVPSDKSNYVSYNVEKGDTLYSIAKNNNISLDTLLLINGFDSNEYIYPGESILVPNENVGIIVIKEGDTLSDLSKYNLNELMNLNSTIYLLPNQLLFYSKKE